MCAVKDGLLWSSDLKQSNTLVIYMELLKCCSVWRFFSLCAVSITMPLWECFHAKMTGTVCPWQLLAPLKKNSHLLANLNRCSLTIHRWNISNSCQSGGPAERLVCYICTFVFITEIGLAVSYRMIQKRTSIWISNRASYNLSEWFLSQDSFSQGDLHGRIFKKTVETNLDNEIDSFQHTYSVSMGTSVEHVLHLAMLSICLFPNSKCVIPSTATVVLWFFYQCAASSQCFFLFCVSLSALPLTVRMSVSLSFLHVFSVCLWSLLSVFGRRLSQGSPPQLLPLLRQRAVLPLPLFSPPVWLFTASSASISTAAPLLTKAYSKRTGKGRCRARVQWGSDSENWPLNKHNASWWTLSKATEHECDECETTDGATCIHMNMISKVLCFKECAAS